MDINTVTKVIGLCQMPYRFPSVRGKLKVYHQKRLMEQFMYKKLMAYLLE